MGTKIILLFFFISYGSTTLAEVTDSGSVQTTRDGQTYQNGSGQASRELRCILEKKGSKNQDSIKLANAVGDEISHIWNQIKPTMMSAQGVPSSKQYPSPEARAHFYANVLHESMNLTARKELGNKTCRRYSGGCRYKGRGLIQVTHKENYAEVNRCMNKYDKIAYPDAQPVARLFDSSSGSSRGGTCNMDLTDDKSRDGIKCAALSAICWWEARIQKLEKFTSNVNSSDPNSVKAVRKIVNGGYNGLKDVKKNWEIANKCMQHKGS